MKYKDLSRREQSRMAQNQRRKIERRMARILTETIGKKVTRKEAIEQYQQSGVEDSGLEALYKTYKSLQAKKGVKAGEKYKKEVYGQNVQFVENAIESFSAIRFGEKGSDVKRRNDMFQRDINQSTRRYGLSTLSPELTHGFYASTQYMWENATSSQERNAYILREFGINDLRTTYNLITKSELKAEDFGFSNEEDFENWLDYVKGNVDLDAIREVFQEQLGDYARAHDTTFGDSNSPKYNASDEWDEKYEKVKIQIANIRKRTARLKSRFS